MISGGLFWLRCNFCSSDSCERSLYLTDCSHIFCLNCLGKDIKLDDINCLTCKKKSRVEKISDNMTKEKLFFFKDPEELMEVFKKKIDKIRSFQNYHQDYNMKLMVGRCKKATNILKSNVKEKEEMKNKYTQLMKLTKDKFGILKKKEEEMVILKEKLDGVEKSMIRHKDNERRLEEKLKKLQSMSQHRQAMKNHSSEDNRTDSFSLKRRRESDAVKSKPKPKYDVSQIPLFPSNKLSAPILKTSNGPEYPTLKRRNQPCPKTQNFSPISGARFNHTKDFFSDKNSYDNLFFKMHGAGDDTDECEYNFNNLNNSKDIFFQGATSTQRDTVRNLPLSLDGSEISRISPYGKMPRI
ncbi:Zinc finger, RING-type domain and Zinc finger, RING/FYVE/PHD-type domain-containing protein [Strongyloides ratti]|uniref:Zinc finger, RING-type domain and Zinc finger, RING/FYVE/PHD-type domain-containing protein n=1 Tax=Strongyloides ratti TaxID=34506 RepID=A0A090L9L2_STRRB|nr:Zinc finger, RING-type domain and Zinc finger, RING/FYVE/PHD-type domain-containing protein [Strongyloides ratti]CEF64813.1 Zinc finger, RING-type domain and Zinc finger, RING/FYVE/PHD-type domain-containing protein [Strongyloides ratti]